MGEGWSGEVVVWLKVHACTISPVDGIGYVVSEHLSQLPHDVLHRLLVRHGLDLGDGEGPGEW